MFMKRKAKKTAAMHAGCAAIALIGCIAVTGMGAAIVSSLANGYAGEVLAAEEKANNYVISIQDEADRISSELNKEQEDALRREIEEAEERQKKALEDHIRDAESWRDSQSESGDDTEHVDGMNIPKMGEEGFNEP